MTTTEGATAMTTATSTCTCGHAVRDHHVQPAMTSWGTMQAGCYAAVGLSRCGCESVVGPRSPRCYIEFCNNTAEHNLTDYGNNPPMQYSGTWGYCWQHAKHALRG